MGCSPSKLFGNSTPHPVQQPKRAHPLVTEEAELLQKIKATEALRKNDPFLVTKTLETIKVQENLRTIGENFTCLHAAAEFDADQSVKLCIEWLNNNAKAQAKEIMNIPDVDGRNPAMAAAYRDCTRAFKAFIQSGLVDLDMKDYQKKDIRTLCNENSLKCLEILDQSLGKAPQADDANKNKIDQNKINNNINNNIVNNNVNNNNVNNNVNNKVIDNKPKDIKPQVQEIKPQNNEISKPKPDVKPQIQDQPVVNQQQSSPVLKDIDPKYKIYAILKDLISKNTNFTDSAFPPSVNSITSNKSHKYYTEHFVKALWKRPHEIFGCDYDQIKVFDGIEPGDIDQGILGVCYFLCSLAAIAEYPSRLLKAFITKEGNKYGAYAVQFYVQGVPTEIVIDDFIPCYHHSPKLPLFSKPKGKELWVMLMEKAWAKLYGNYTVTEAGSPAVAMESILSCPTKTHLTNKQSDDEIWANLTEADKNKFIMTCSTFAQTNEGMGLVAGHAYSIISVHNVSGRKILKIRNPWGKFEWKGDWSDTSSLWTDDLKRQVGFTNVDDGTFFMGLGDFKKNFEAYGIGYYHDDFQYEYLVDTCHPKHANYYKFSVDQDCEVYFRIHQRDKRFTQKDGDEDAEEKYSSASFRICRVEEDGLYSDVLPDPGDVDNDSFFGAISIYSAKDKKSMKLTPGDYIIRAKVRWHSGNEEKYTLSAYSSVKLNIEKTEPIKQFYYYYYMYHGSRHKKMQDMRQGCKFANGFLGDHMFCYFENNGENNWELDITFKDMKNLQLSKMNNPNGSACQFTVSPGGKEVLVVKKIEPHLAASNAWDFKQKWT